MRSFITKTTINKLISASNRLKKEQAKIALINSQGGNEKEKAIKTFLSNVNFDSETRVARLEFIQTQEYRTIERYVTQNYVKYPIFSEWKVKKKVIKKTIKLTNSELESLNVNSDELIRFFAKEIIIKLNNKELYPSWYIKLNLKKEKDDNLQVLNDELNNFKNELSYKIANEENAINLNTSRIIDLKNELYKNNQKLSKQKNKLIKLKNQKRSLYKIIFSFGIYSLIYSKKHLTKIQSKVNDINKCIEKDENKINELDKLCNNLNLKIKDYQIKLNEKEKEIEAKKSEEINNYNKKLLQIKPLGISVNKNDEFILLKHFNGIKYEKINGCYIIHNKENDKYYVGQSKDVLKRLKQHFKGTTPKNSIFAEDYYTSTLKNKEDLFEVKIIKCETKDELDKMEKSLIYKYDSWNNGYNGTSGNL